MSSNKTSHKTAVPAKTKSASKAKPFLLLLPALLIGFTISFAVVSRLNHKPTATNAGVITTDGKTIHNVDLRKDNNQPIDLLVNTGEYVQFNSKDGGKHQIVAGGHTGGDHGGHGQVDSGVFNDDQGYLLQFKEIGKFDFHDNLDRDYTITVIVYDPSKSAEDSKLKTN